VALVTDAIAAAGAGDGRSTLGGAPVEVRDGVARREDGTLAGSTLTMDAAVRTLHALGAPLVEAVGAATAVPARVLGRPELGVLRAGGPADLVVLDDRLEIRRVLLDGRERAAA
jgi:N-acetylglucosamine-6-phosphate deacetylase